MDDMIVSNGNTNFTEPSNEDDEIAESVPTNYTDSTIHNIVAPTEFSTAVDTTKINIVKDAQETDTQFVSDLKSKVKNAALESVGVEESKAKLEKQNIDYYSGVLKTKQLRNEQDQLENKWDNRAKRREFHYNGVKPIMEFVGINSPMNLIILYLFTIILSPFYIINKLLQATIGALLAGTQNEDRSKAAKGVLWTMICLMLLFLLGFLVIVLLKVLGIDIINYFKYGG